MDINGWVCTDPDIQQYCKRISEKEFVFIEMVWLDICKADEGYPDKEYTVKSAFVDLDDYSEKDMEIYVSGYYDRLDELRTEYGGYSGNIIAECIFEEICDGFARTYGMMTKKEAEIFIKEYIMEN